MFRELLWTSRFGRGSWHQAVPDHRRKYRLNVLRDDVRPTSQECPTLCGAQKRELSEDTATGDYLFKVDDDVIIDGEKYDDIG